MSKPLINAADAETHSEKHGAHFEYSMTELSHALGAKAIGANLTRVPPGKAAFPFHHHAANEEHFFVISGSGILRFGDESLEVKTLDYILCPPGGSDRAHQLINVGEQDLVYLAFSTLLLPEVVGYPDTGKTGVATRPDTASRFLMADASKRPRTTEEYWKDEEGAGVEAVLARARVADKK